VISLSKELDNNEKIKRHRIKKSAIYVVFMLIVIVLLVGFFVYLATKKYKDFEVLSTVDKETRGNTYTIKYQKGFIKYDNDGITYYDSNNKVIWQQVYELRNPMVKICDKYVGVAGIGSSTVFIFNDNGLVSTFDVALKISEIEISGVGASVVTLEDGDINYIRMFDEKGKLVYDIKRVIDGEGYPLSVAVSNDATKLCVSSLCYDKTERKSKLSFYNFSSIGNMEVDNFVGGYDLDEIAMELHFANNNKLVVIGENSISAYDFEQYPRLLKSENIKTNTDSLYVGDKRYAFVHKENNKYIIEVYSDDCRRLLNYESDFNPQGITFCKEYVMLYNEKYARMIDYMGRIRFEYNFDVPLNSIVWMNGKTRFAFVNVKSIQQVRLK